jgi:tetratricopeptide (TPR) repeat protein
MRTTFAVLVLLLHAPAIFAATPRIVFERVLPAAHDLGSVHDVAIVHAASEDPQLEPFLDTFAEQVDRSGAFRIRDARNTTGPADVHLDIKTFRCETAVRESEAGMRDIDGKRVKHQVFHVEAVCGARIEVLSRFLKPVSTFFAKGEGTSPRVDEVTDEARENALADAARYAARDAAERITPRRVRESIVLDDTAPSFAEGMAMIEAGQLGEARAIWQKAMQREPRSPALRFNLGAVNEALGDRRAAELHYNAARQLAPSEPRYASELKSFLRRGARPSL